MKDKPFFVKMIIIGIIVVIFLCWLWFNPAQEKCYFDNKTNICTCLIENRPSLALGWDNYTYKTCMKLNNQTNSLR